LLNQWKNYQKGKANAWAPSTTNFYGGDLAQAYRLYTLALSKSAEMGAMNRLREFKYLSAEAKWKLAAAYKLAGQDNIAVDLIAGLPTTFTQRPTAGFTYGSDLRDQAIVLETLTLLGRKQQAATVLTEIAAKLSDENWYSTQTTAYSLLAIAKYCGKNASGAKIMAATNLAGKSENINASSYVKQLPIVLKDGSNAASITNSGTNILYVKIITQGQPLTGDTIKTANSSAALNMIISYISQNGTAVDISKLTQGTDFIAKVTIKNTGSKYYSQMALSQIFPSGWEILNHRQVSIKMCVTTGFTAISAYGKMKRLRIMCNSTHRTLDVIFLQPQIVEPCTIILFLPLPMDDGWRW
jgi:alpha-2-macroglobulin